jgi:hypothetical protein
VTRPKTFAATTSYAVLALAVVWAGAMSSFSLAAAQDTKGGLDLPKGVDLDKLKSNAGGIYGRGDAKVREAMIKVGGGSAESEAAVDLGLKFLKRMQTTTGNWKLDDDAYGPKEKGQVNDIAATALAMLPFLARGHTLEPKTGGEKNPYAGVMQKAFNFLKTKQQKNGSVGTGGYTHAISTIALCELYALVKDPALKKSVDLVAKAAVKYLVDAQSQDGGWRYGFRDLTGDMSVAGWSIMALKAADKAGIKLPKNVMEKAAVFVDTLVDEKTEGYTYVKGAGGSASTSAVGLLCRQYLHGWNAANPRMIKGVENNIVEMDGNKTKFNLHPDQKKNIYYFYYATQALYHLGGEHWGMWNEVMREQLIKTQVKDPPKGQEKLEGSWDAAGDTHGTNGGRLMYTALALLTLEVYYRHVPLYYRDVIKGGK